MQFLFFPSENDPCPNTVVEALLAGVPVCFNPLGGTVELVNECGVPLSRLSEIISNWRLYREKSLTRNDLRFDNVAQKYLKLC